MSLILPGFGGDEAVTAEEALAWNYFKKIIFKK